MTIELYIAWVKKQLEDNGYYVENTDKGGLTFSMTNRVRGLEGFYCDLTRDELVYQCDNSDAETLKEIETEMLEIFTSNETKLRQYLEKKNS
jgi:hypothetical protein